MYCPKCRGMMRTYSRGGVQIEQCDACRGIFLDYGELEAIGRLENSYHRPAAYPSHAPAWGAHYNPYYHRRPKSALEMLFST